MSWWQRLQSVFRGGPRPSELSTPVIGSQSVWKQFSRIGGNLTPSDVSSIILQADSGDCSRLVDLANDCRQKIGQLHTCLHTRENALAQLPLTISPYKARDDRDPLPRDAEVAAFVDEVLRGAVGDGQDSCSLDELVPHLQGGVYHGHAVAENYWARLGRQLIITGFHRVDQRRFGFSTDTGRLVYQPNGRGWGTGVDLMTAYPAQFTQHQPRINGDVAVREGLSHLLVWPATFINWDIVDWLRLAELAWKPWRIAHMAKGAGDKAKANLINALQQLTNNGVALIGDAEKIELLWPGQQGGRTSSTHRELADWMCSEISKSVLGQTLTTDAGERGARSLGEVHERVRQDIRNQDARAIAATIRRCVVAPLVVFNYGPSTPIPGVAYETDDSVDVAAFAAALTELRAAGLRIPEWWAYDVSGVPEPRDDEAVLGWQDVDLKELETDEEQAIAA